MVRLSVLAVVGLSVALIQCSSAASLVSSSAGEIARASNTAGMWMISRTASREAMEAMERSMTIESALAAVHRLGRPGLDRNPLIVALMQKGAGALRGHHHRASSGTAPNTATPAPGSGVFMALTMLNDMISEAEHKLDLEEVRCSEFEKKRLELIEQTRQDIAMYNAIASEARSEILAAQTQIDMLTQRIPELNTSLDQLMKKCATETAALRAQLAVLEGDITVMNRVVAMTNCAQSSALMQLNMVRCKGPKYGDKSLIQFTHHVLNKAIASLKSDVAKQGLERRLAAAFQETKHVSTALVQFDPPATPTSAEPPKDKANKKCSVANSPVCHKMLDRFLGIQTDIVDKRDTLQEQLKELETQCENDKANLEAQIASFETRLKDEQTKLAAATKKQNDAEEQSRLKSSQLEEVTADYVKTMKECKSNIEELHAEICGAKKIRKEIFKMSDLTALVADCEVSDWVPGECTVTCGGGMQLLNRSVSIQPAYGGAACPPLTMDRTCNDFPCPIDCEIEMWSGWSTCSADCGGGVKERSRSVITVPQHGGVRCGETTETEPCNMQSCDKDCELAEWTPWGPCSKECDGGLTERVRHVAEPAHGHGTCPDSSSEEREEYLECNTHPCIPFGTSPDTPLLCGSEGHGVKQDIVILLDGSGSLGSAGWRAVKET